MSPREEKLKNELAQVRALRQLPQVGTELAAYADLIEARVFARECEQSVEEWFNFDNIILESPTWAAAYELHKKLADDN